LSNAALGENLARLRRSAGVSQTVLGAPLFSTSYISLLEAGRRPWTWPLLTHLAQRLECRPEDILPVDQWRSEWIVPRLRAALSGDDREAILTVGPLLEGRRDVVGARLHREVGERLLQWDLVEPARRLLTVACSLLLTHREYESGLTAGFGAIEAALRDQGPAVAEQIVLELQSRVPLVDLAPAKGKLLSWKAEIELQREGFGTALQLAAEALKVATAADEEATALRLMAHARFELGDVELAMTPAALAVERVRTGPFLEVLTVCALLKACLANRGGHRVQIEESARLLEELVGGPLQDSVRLRTAVRIELVRCLAATAKRPEAESTALHLLASGLLTDVQRAALITITGEIAWDTGDIDTAVEKSEEAHAALYEMGLRRTASRTLVGLADRLLGIGDTDRAAEVYRRALVTASITQGSGRPFE
jgi:tetratricopeptide (TPR) repeat protein